MMNPNDSSPFITSSSRTRKRNIIPIPVPLPQTPQHTRSIHPKSTARRITLPPVTLPAKPNHRSSRGFPFEHTPNSDLFTPKPKLIQPDPSAFVSTGLISKRSVSKNNGELWSNKKPPETPGKKTPSSMFFNRTGLLSADRPPGTPIFAGFNKPVEEEHLSVRPKHRLSFTDEEMSRVRKRVNFGVVAMDTLQTPVPKAPKSVRTNKTVGAPPPPLPSLPQSDFSTRLRQQQWTTDEDEQDDHVFGMNKQFSTAKKVKADVANSSFDSSVFGMGDLNRSLLSDDDSFLFQQDDASIFGPTAMHLDDERQQSEFNSSFSVTHSDIITPFAHFLDKAYFTNQSDDSYYPIDHHSPDHSDYYDTSFAIKHLMGTGEFSHVHSVRMHKDNKLYAVKRTKLPFHGVNDRRRKLQEVRLLWQIGQHPHCVELHQAWEQHGHLYIQTDLCTHGTFKSWLDSHQVQDARIWRIVRSIASGLKHLHDHHVMHLDLKPDNIFLTQDWTLKIGDFGHASLYPPIHTSYLEEGDRVYLAPEILNASNYTPKADLYSLGLMLLEMLADVVLPDNGDTWINLRNGDLSDVDLTPAQLQTTNKGLSRDECATLATIVKGLVTASPGTRNSLEWVMKRIGLKGRRRRGQSLTGP